MAKLTWLGSTEGYREGETPLDSCTWNGVLFTCGDRVEVTDEWMIAKAHGNRFFRVEEDEITDRAVMVPITQWRSVPITQWRSDTEADPADVSFFDDPPEIDQSLNTPPDYPPVDDPDRKAFKRRGRPPRVRENGDGK